MKCIIWTVRCTKFEITKDKGMPENKAPTSQVEKVIRNQIDSLQEIPEYDLSDYVPAWRARTHRFLQGNIVDEELAIFSDISASTYEKDRELFLKFLQDLIVGVRDTPELFLVNSAEAPDPKESEPSKPVLSSSSSVFIVHGHDETAKLDVARTIEKMGLSAIILHEQPNQGRTVIEKFESNASEVGFAIILLTPDDIGAALGKEDNLQPRARQNVVLELGYFSALLGRDRVAVLYKEAVEIPSDYLGVVYTKMDEAGSWKFALAKELKIAGVDVDLNTLV